MKLRPYQRQAVEAVVNAVDPFGGSYNRVIYTCPTGSGKTIIFAELTKTLVSQGKHVLILAHRKELIGQAYNRIKEHSGLSDIDMGMEIAENKAGRHAKVIIGSVQTCYREHRLPDGWTPDTIICDESHHSSSETYKKIADRFGVFRGECNYIGCTATAKRTDKASLYAIDVDGNPVMLERKGRKPTPAKPDESVFERLVYNYTVLDAIEDGWLVAPRGHVVETATDINEVKTVGGDFVESQLAKKVDNENRTLQAISAWKQIASDRPTLVFCASVEHAHHAAELWTQAGYIAAAVDGKTDATERYEIFRDFQSGRLQVLCNMGIATEGTDLPTCSCIVFLRPTKSWNLYMQMAGRASRVLPGVLDALQEVSAEERKLAIAASGKPDSIIIDLVDLYKDCGSLCSVPSILDLPIKLDLQGHSIIEAKKLMDEYEENRERIIGECPINYEDLKVIVKRVNMIDDSGAKTAIKWNSTDDGYRFTGTPPKYEANMLRNDNDNTLLLKVTCQGQPIQLGVKPDGTPSYQKRGKVGRNLNEYLDKAVEHVKTAIEEHRKANRKGTLTQLTSKQVYVLTRNGHTRAEVDAMTTGYAKKLISGYMDKWHKENQSTASKI